MAYNMATRMNYSDISNMDESHVIFVKCLSLRETPFFAFNQNKIGRKKLHNVWFHLYKAQK